MKALGQVALPRLQLNLLAGLATLLFIDLFSVAAAMHCNGAPLCMAPWRELPSPAVLVLFVASYLLTQLFLLPCFHDVSIASLAYCCARRSAGERSGTEMPFLNFLFRTYQRAVYRLSRGAGTSFEERWLRNELVFRLACLFSAEMVLAARGESSMLRVLMERSLAISLPVGGLVAGVVMLLAACAVVSLLAEGKRLALEIGAAGIRREDWRVIVCEGADS